MLGMENLNDLKLWLTSSDLEVYTPPVFERSLLLHKTKLFGSGIASIINGGTTAALFKVEPGWFKFNWLLEVLGRLNNREESHFFEVRSGSNAYDPQVFALHSHDFINNQYSSGVQNVLARLDTDAELILLAPFSKSWLLQCDRGGDGFEMSLGGSSSFCSAVATHLGIDL